MEGKAGRAQSKPVGGVSASPAACSMQDHPQPISHEHINRGKVARKNTTSAMCRSFAQSNSRDTAMASRGGLYATLAESDTESESEQSVGEIQETRPARRWLSDSESESDQERGRVLSEKERRWNAIIALGATIANALKNKDWSKVFDGACVVVATPGARTHFAARPSRCVWLVPVHRGWQARIGAGEVQGPRRQGCTHALWCLPCHARCDAALACPTAAENPAVRWFDGRRVCPRKF